MELDRVDPAHADLCRDFFSRAVVLELSFFEAAYTSLCAIGNIRTCTTKVRLRLCAHARDECRSQSTGPEGSKLRLGVHDPLDDAEQVEGAAREPVNPGHRHHVAAGQLAEHPV